MNKFGIPDTVLQPPWKVRRLKTVIVDGELLSGEKHGRSHYNNLTQARLEGRFLRRGLVISLPNLV